MDKKKSHRKKVTIYDIAREAETSTATVSRVLSNSGYPVKEEMRKKILLAAEKLNYLPNSLGRMLKKSESMDIGVIIPTISNPFYPQVILGIELEARRRSYNILLCNSFRDPDTEKKYITSLVQKQVKGIIISSIDENHMFLKQMIENEVKIVVFDQDIDRLKCNKVGFDFLKGGMIAVEHLIKNGHRNIAFVSAPLTRKSRRETMEGYKLALLKNELPFNENNIIISETEEEFENATYEFENGRGLVKKFLEIEERPTAIFAVNDMTAFGVIRELWNNNILVPDDVSVVGFDNIEVSTMINPPLTTVNQPSFETGRLACKTLLDSMEDSNYGEVSITLEPSLVERKSVKNITV